MQRFSVSLDDELAEWVKAQADTRGVSKAKVIRDAVAIAKETGLTPEEASGTDQSEPVTERLQRLEARLTALEQYPSPESGQSETAPSQGRAGIVAIFEQSLDESPPETAHGTAAVVDVFALLLDEGPLKTAEVREKVYRRHTTEFTDARTMWQSIQRHFDQIPGIQKVGYGEWNAAPAAVLDSHSSSETKE